jgi:hypothetical protein
MESLKDVAHISGKSGLFKILKPGRGGVIVESLDEKKEKMMVSAQAQVSILKDISMYTNDRNVSTPLGDIFLNIDKLFPEGIEIEAKTASKNQLFEFLAKVLPDFDAERIRESDIKKLISWFKIVKKQLPEAFQEVPKEETASEIAEPAVAAPAKKTSKKK